MSNTTEPNYTPNVVVSDPRVRKIVGNTLAVASVILSLATLVDGAIAELDYGNVTGPAAVIIAGIFGIFQIGVTSPNIPSK
jgi:ABC-type amino acid transport system permease subunit